MMAVVIRRKSDRYMVAFGPADGMYVPRYDDTICDYAVEADYESVLEEWKATRPAILDKRASVLANPLVPQWFKDFIG